MKPILCAVCLVAALHGRVLAEESVSDSLAAKPDSVASKSDSVAADPDSVATEIDSTPLVRTAISTDPLLLALSRCVNLSIEQMITESISAKLDGYWGVGGAQAKAITGSVRYRFSPGLAGKSVGVFVRALQEDLSLELEVDGEKGTYKLRNEGIVAGLNYGSRTVWMSGFSINWYLGAGWPFLHQEWLGAAPKTDASLNRKIYKVSDALDGGVDLGWSF